MLKKNWVLYLLFCSILVIDQVIKQAILKSGFTFGSKLIEISFVANYGIAGGALKSMDGLIKPLFVERPATDHQNQARWQNIDQMIVLIDPI